MGKYAQDAKSLLQYVGGKENINAVTHCMTRMRFVLKDEKLAEVKAIEKIGCVKGTFTQSGQFQVIIGNDVQNFYNEFIDLAGIQGVDKAAVKDAAKSNQSKMQKLMGDLGEIFAPLIPALICGGLILGFRNIIDSIKLFEDFTKTLVEISQFWAGVDSFLWLIGEAVFHFLPVGIVWSITKKMGTTQILGIILGLTLVSPQLLNAYNVASTAAADIPVWNFGGFSIQMIGYQAQVIPAMLAGFVLVYLEKFWRRHCPEYISMIVVPFLSLLPAVIIAHTVVGPIGWQIGDAISQIVYAGLSSNLKWLFAALFGFVYAPLVITGLHHMTNAIDTQLVSSFGGTILWPMIALSNIAQGSAVLAMSMLQKKNDRAQQINIPACISCYLGVTEPALFGVNLKYMFPFVCGMIGSSIAAMISVGFGVQAISIGVGGLPGFLSIYFQYWPIYFLAIAVAIVVPFCLTYAIGKKKLSREDVQGEQEESETIAEVETKEPTIDARFVSPMSGELVELSEVADQAFASKAMGDGFAVDVQSEIVVSPVQGTVAVCFPTGHAYGIQGVNGCEVLLHIGMDTVELNGKGFKPLVKQGDHVEVGDPLVEVDIAYIKAQGKSLVSPVVFTSGQKVELLHTGKVAAGQEDLVHLEA